MINVIVMIVWSLGLFVLLCVALLLLWFPVIILVLNIVFTLFGKKSVLECWFNKIGFQNKYSSTSSLHSCDSMFVSTLQDEDNHILANQMEDDSKWLSDTHLDPSYSCLPSNTSYNTIGPGSWNNDIEH